MDQVITAILGWATSQGVGVLMLVFAIYWLNGENKKAAAEVKDALDVSHNERQARVDVLAQNITSLTKRVDDCERDRSNLWNQIVSIAKSQQPPKE